MNIFISVVIILIIAALILIFNDSPSDLGKSEMYRRLRMENEQRQDNISGRYGKCNGSYTVNW